MKTDLDLAKLQKVMPLGEQMLVHDIRKVYDEHLSIMSLSNGLLTLRARGYVNSHKKKGDHYATWTRISDFIEPKRKDRVTVYSSVHPGFSSSESILIPITLPAAPWEASQ